MSKNKTQSIALSAQLIELDGTAPTEIRLLPAGLFKAIDGRPQGLPGWVMDDAAATALLSARAGKKDKFLIDYGHQTLYSPQNGLPAVAAGWSSTLEWRSGDGLYAVDMDWTAAACSGIEAKEWRYISPVIEWNAKTGVITNIKMAALVNYAALDGLNDMAAMAVSLFFNSQEPTMELDELLDRLRYFLNLPTLATDTDILAELEKLKALVQADIAADSTEATAGLSALLSHKNTQIAALAAQTYDPAQFVPIAMMTEMQTELSALSAIVNADNISKLIAPALADGRLLPAQKEWAETLGKSDLAALSGYLNSAQPIAALAGMQTGGKSPGDDTEVKSGFKVPDGFSINTEQAALHAKIVTHQKTHNIDYKTAALAVGAGQ